MRGIEIIGDTSEENFLELKRLLETHRDFIERNKLTASQVVTSCCLGIGFPVNAALVKYAADRVLIRTEPSGSRTLRLREVQKKQTISNLEENIGKLDDLILRMNDHEKNLHELSERMEKHEKKIKEAQHYLSQALHYLDGEKW